MIDIYDCEAIIKCYRYLEMKCEAIDKSINSNALYYGPSLSEFGAEDVLNTIMNLIERKNKLINMKVILDNAVKSLDDLDRQILYIKMHYSLSIGEICGILGTYDRNVFRRCERAFGNLAKILNTSSYAEKLSKMLDTEVWISAVRSNIRERHLSYNTAINNP